MKPLENDPDNASGNHNKMTVLAREQYVRIDVYCLANLNKQRVFLENEESDAIKISQHVQCSCIILRSWLECVFISTVDIFQAGKRFLNANGVFDLGSA